MKVLSDLKPVDSEEETSKKKKKGVVSNLKPVEDSKSSTPKTTLPMPVPDTLAMMQRYPAALQTAIEKAPLLEKTRPSDPGKQLVGGVSDLGTGFASLLGMIGGGIEAASKTPVAEFDEVTGTWKTPVDEIGHPGLRRQKTFTDRYDQATQQGIDKALLEAGVSGRKNVNEALGIKEPVSSEDLAARLLGTLIPIPGSQIQWAKKGADLMDRLGNIAKLTGYLATPMVQAGKGYKTRALAQIGVGTGIDQGLRAATDQPLMLSKEALAGIDPTKQPPAPPEKSKTVAKKGVISELVPVSDSTKTKGVISDLVPVSNQSPYLVRSRTEQDDIKTLQEYDQKVLKQEEWEDLKTWAWWLTGILVTGGATRHYLHRKKAPTGQVEKQSDGSVNVKEQTTGSVLHGEFVDKATHLKDGLRQVGVSETAATKVVSNAHTDTLDLANNFLRSGRLGQNFGRSTHSPSSLVARFNRLSTDQQTAFNEGMKAMTEKATKFNKKIEDSPGSLWKTQRTDAELDALIKRATSDPDVNLLMTHTHEVYDTLLDYSVHRGVLRPKDAEQFRAGARLPPDASGKRRLAYMPAYKARTKSFLEKLSSTFLGLHNAEARRAEYLSIYAPRSKDFDVDSVMSPLQALERYSISVVKNSNEQSFMGNVLDKLSGVTRTGDDGVNVARNVVPGTYGALSPTARGTVYLGKGTDLNNPDSIPFEAMDSPDAKRLLKGFDGSIRDLAGREGFADNLITVHQGGEIRVYYVPDKGLRAALDLRPQISNGLLQVGNHWKNIFTRLTTGDWSLFAPISGVYSAQQIAKNTFARDGVIRGVTSPLRSMSGVGRLFLTNATGDIAKYLSRRVGTHLGEDVPPTFMQKLTERLERVHFNSAVTTARAETGRMTSSTYSAIGDGTLPEILEGVVKPNARFYGADEAGLLADIWRSWNNAWHEGPTYGAYLKYLGDEIIKAEKAGKPLNGPQAVRDAMDASKAVAGDMRRVGASGLAKAFNETVPFSAAMIQSWNSIGAAARKNPVRFTAGVGALIGTPTVTELVHNKGIHLGAVDDNGQPITFTDPKFPEKQWTYNDYYWNGFSTEQRVNNFIYFQPGKPPWEAIIVPVSPEWSLARATIIEGMDAVFNFSDVGNIGKVDADKVNREHFLIAFARVFDVPLPPLVAAMASALDADVHLGLASKLESDPTDPGRATSIIRTQPYMKGERLTARSSKARFAASDLERKVVAIAQDLFGSAATMYIAMHESFMAGSRKKSGGTVERGLEMAFESLGAGVKSQMRYGQGNIFGQVLRPKQNDEIAQSLHVGRDTIKNLTANLNNVLSGGGKYYMDGMEVKGDTLIPSDDPLMLEMSAAATKVDEAIKVLDESIFKLTRDLKTIPNSMVGAGTRWKNIKERDNEYDQIVLRIQSLKTEQLAEVHRLEDIVADHLEKRYGREIEVDFTSFSARPNLPSQDSLSKGLGIAPQTSR